MGRWELLEDFEAEPDWKMPLAITGGGRSDLGRAILRTIVEARQSLRIMTPIVNDPQVEAALVSARMRRMSVKLITELSDKAGEFGSTPNRAPGHDHSVRKLASKRIFCRGMGPCSHAKLIIADERAAWVSSMNLDSNCLGWSEQPSLEAGLLLEEPAHVEALVRSFDALWNACSLQLIVDRADISLQNVTGANRTGPLDLDHDLEDLAIRWSYPAGGRGLRNRLIDIVDKTRRRLILCSLSFYDTQAIAGFQDALLAARARRGSGAPGPHRELPGAPISRRRCKYTRPCPSGHETAGKDRSPRQGDSV